MKKVLLVLCLIIGGSVLVTRYIFQTGKSVSLVQPSITPAPQNTGSLDIETEADSLKIDWIIVRDLSLLSLHSNTEAKLSSSEAKSSLGCSQMVSSGFYDTEGKHIGLFKAGSETFSEYQDNRLFNGIFTIHANGLPEIAYTLTASNSPIALQVGPVVYFTGKPTNLKLTRDETARRVVAATNKQNEVVFLVFYNTTSKFVGPLLADLPKLIAELNKNTSLDIVNAINMDGGTASTFVSKFKTLSELSPVGGFFCIKD